MASKKKTPVRELLRLALIFAIQDRDGYAHADPGAYGAEAKELAAEFRALLKRRYRTTTASDQIDADVASGKIGHVSIEELRQRHDPAAQIKGE